MVIIPALDLLDGKCVRLFKGEYNASTVYSHNPAEIARMFEDQGAQWIHVVDLDAARGQGKNNRSIIREIRDAVSCMVEVGGGIRDDKDVLELTNMDIDRLVLGTILVQEPDKVREWADKYGAVFIAGIDAKDGKVKVSGWESDAQIEDLKLTRDLGDMGMNGIIYTSIVRDGTLSGPDIERTNAVAAAGGLPVILSGGISSYEDIEQVFKQRHPNVRGLITGKALYENMFSLEEVIDRFQIPYQSPPDDEW